MARLVNILCTSLWILVLLHQLFAAPAPVQNPASTTTTVPVTDQKAASSEEAQNTDKGANGNVYGADNGANSGEGSHGNQSNQPRSRGYNQGYSYNTGIKPYRTGYTYFQPFGDAADQQNPNGQNGQAAAAAPKAGSTGGAAGQPAAKAPALPVQLPNFFGIDPKQMGPVRVIPNQNVPVDENGIPILDAIKIPENNNAGGKSVAAPAPVPVPPAQTPNIPQDFNIGNDFNLNQILGNGGVGGVQPQVNYQTQPVQQQQQPYSNPASDNSMFDFAPPSAQNFDLPTNGGSRDGRDYNRLDNFAGNLNNFDTYLGDSSLPMMDGPVGGGGSGGGGGNGGDAFGFGGGNQQPQTTDNTVPAELVNLNNAFGSNTNQASNNDMMNILNQLNGGGNQQQPSNEMDFGNFGNAATNRNQFFPFF